MLPLPFKHGSQWTDLNTALMWLETVSFIGNMEAIWSEPETCKWGIQEANDTVLDFARHYGASVLPARPRHPQTILKRQSACG